MTLGIVYHMPFWRADDGTLYELEGSFARYVDSLAPYFDQISICAPAIDPPATGGTRLRSANVVLAPLPRFDGPRQFYPQLLSLWPRISRWVSTLDMLHCRIPTPAAFPSFLAARKRGLPIFLLVVGDLRALLPSMPYRGVKRVLWKAYTAFEERTIQWMVERSVTFANGAALAAKHRRRESPVIETRTTTISAEEILDRTDTCGSPTIRLLTVSRIDPRKGLGVLPDVVRRLIDDAVDVTLDVIGPVVGRPGQAELDGLRARAEQLGVTDRVRWRGPVPLDELMPAYRHYDVFVLPTLPGEGIPRVLMEAMASGVPVVASRVAGVPNLITHEVNGLLVDSPTVESLVAAVSRVVHDGALRRRLIAAGRETAREHTLEAQAARMMRALAAASGVPLRNVAAA
jgi:glycosyltransferase involved in cell wall biosynthesis